MVTSLLSSDNLDLLLITFNIDLTTLQIGFEILNQTVAEISIKHLLTHPGILCCQSESV